MAAGIGTRMKSATPKHLHPLLGRRMVDWVVEAARDAGVERIVVVASPQTSDLLDGVEVAVQEEPLGTGDAVRCAREALEDFGGDVLVLNGDVPALRPETIRALVETHRARRRRRDRPLLRARGRRRVRADRARRRRPARADRRGARRLARGARAARGQLRHLRLPRREALAGARTARRRTTPRASSTSPTRSACSSADGEPCAVQLADDPLEAEGVNTRAELALAAASLRDRINEAHMLAGVTIVDPASTWIEAGVEIEPDVVVHPYTVIRGGVRIESGVEIGPFASSAGDRARRGREDRHVRRGQERARVGACTKIPHLSYIGDAEMGEDTNVAAGNITANFKHVPGQPKGGRRSAATSGPAWTMSSMPRSRLATTLGLRQGRSSRMMCLPVRWPGSPRARTRRKGGSTRSMESPTAIELALPGLEGASLMSEPSTEHYIVRGPQKRLMVFSGRSHPSSRRRSRRSSASSSATSSSRRSRTTRRTAATSSRSAAPTSSSSRPAARRWTRTSWSSCS